MRTSSHQGKHGHHAMCVELCHGMPAMQEHHCRPGREGKHVSDSSRRKRSRMCPALVWLDEDCPMIVAVRFLVPLCVAVCCACVCSCARLWQRMRACACACDARARPPARGMCLRVRVRVYMRVCVYVCVCLCVLCVCSCVCELLCTMREVALAWACQSACWFAHICAHLS